MSTLLIRGPTELNGDVSVRGGKNAALPLLFASAVSDEPVILDNVPTDLNDVTAALEALRYVGCSVEVSDGRVELRSSEIKETSVPFELASRIRYSLLFLGLFSGKCGHVKIAMPGGCKLGDRKFDLHLEGLRQLGATVDQTNEGIEVTADRLVGADIEFYLPTTTGTENIMIAACFAEGRTRIFNANTRPEIADLGKFLNKLGANVSVKNRVVEVEGPTRFHGGSHSVMPGWDEALTYMIAAGMTGGEICVKGFSPDHIRQDIAYLCEAGVDVFYWGGNVYVSGKNRQLRAFDLFTAPYPGVNSDMQPLFASLASQCAGESTITDQRFTDRFQYVGELRKLGVQVESYGNCAVVHGPAKLNGARAEAIDLRCGAALVLAALAAEGTTQIDNPYQIHRGYEHLQPRLTALGAQVEEREA